MINYDNKRIYKVRLDYDYFRSNNLGSKVRETLEQIEENQSFLIVYTNNSDEQSGYYLYNTRIIISPLAIKQKKEITQSLVQIIKNSKFDETDKTDNTDQTDKTDYTIGNNVISNI
jgi:hypothetical protein